MKERKNLENLFQDKFENFNIFPPDNAWENIELKLKEKKDRRIIPFWWKLSGIAASLVIGFFIINGISNSNSKNTIINEDNNVVTKSKLETNKAIKSENEIVKTESNKNKVVQEENKIGINHSNPIFDSKDNSITNSDNVKNNQRISNSNQYNSSNKWNVVISNDKNLKSKIAIKLSNNQNNTIVSNKKSEINSKQLNGIFSNELDKNNLDSNKNEVVSTEKFKENKAKLGSEQLSKQYNTTIVDEKKSDNNKQLAQNNTVKIDENSAFKNELNKQSYSNNNVVKTENNTVSKENDIKTIDDIKKIDSTKIAIVEPNALEELLKEKEKKTIEKLKLNRWQLSTNVAPIYFNSSNDSGSPIDAKLADNKKTYETNLSYGVGVNYAITKKIKIRTGINTVSFNYNTNDVTFYQTNNASKLKNLNVNDNGSLVQIENKNGVQSGPEISGNGTLLKKFDSSLNQKFGYIEIPVEVSYAIINKKIGIEILGGLSTLFLNQNQVYLESAGVKMDIGQASNLNAIHYSGNLGLGIKYSIFKHIEAKVEPVIKYQINTFSTDTGSFKPYILGIYSGLSYTF